LSEGFKRVAFADPLKEGLAISLRIPVNYFYDEDLKDAPLPEIFGPTLAGKTPRFLMTRIGTEGYRHLIGDGVWCDVWSRWYRENGYGYDILMDDVRMVNEADTILANGGYLIGIFRSSVGMCLDHESERSVSLAIQKVHATIDNNGTLEDLRERALYAVRWARVHRG